MGLRQGAAHLWAYVWAILGVAGLTILIRLVHAWLPIPNLSMVYLLLVLWLGARQGIGPAISASIAAFLAYDFFFVPPIGTFTVSDPNELFGLVLLLAAALVTGRLAASLRAASAESAQLAEQSRVLYELAIQALRTPDVAEAIGLLCERARALSWVRRFSLLAAEEDELHLAGGDEPAPDELQQSRWVLANQTAVGASMRPGGLLLVRTAAELPSLVVLPISGGVAMMSLVPNRLDSGQSRLLAALVSLGSLLLDRRSAAFQAQRAASLEASDRLKAAVLSSLSHELKSPLAALRAGLTALLEPQLGLSQDDREMVAGMDRETARLDRLVGELLIMSRLEAGQPLELGPRSFPELCGAVIDRLSSRLSGRQLKIDLPAELPPVLMDELQLDRVLTNLLENAIAFTDEGAEIEVGARSEGKELRAWVANQGPMIPAGDLTSIFDKFWSGRSTGTGLGLAICRRIIESHGGRIEVSNRRSGPRFQFTLPLAAEVGSAGER